MGEYRYEAIAIEICRCCWEDLDNCECYWSKQCDRCWEEVCNYTGYKWAVWCNKCIDTIKEMRDDNMNTNPLDFNFNL